MRRCWRNARKRPAPQDTRYNVKFSNLEGVMGTAPSPWWWPEWELLLWFSGKLSATYNWVTYTWDFVSWRDYHSLTNITYSEGGTEELAEQFGGMFDIPFFQSMPSLETSIQSQLWESDHWEGDYIPSNDIETTAAIVAQWIERLLNEWEAGLIDYKASAEGGGGTVIVGIDWDMQSELPERLDYVLGVFAFWGAAVMGDPDLATYTYEKVGDWRELDDKWIWNITDWSSEVFFLISPETRRAIDSIPFKKFLPVEVGDWELVVTSSNMPEGITKDDIHRYTHHPATITIVEDGDNSRITAEGHAGSNRYGFFADAWEYFWASELYLTGR